MVRPSLPAFSFHTMAASPSPLASASAICGAVVEVVMVPEALTCSMMPASAMALTAILPIGVDSGSPSRRVSHFTRSLTVWMPLGLSAGTTRTGMCLTRSVLVAT